MVTVTDNSVQQINAALLSIKKELGSTNDSLGDIVSLKLRIDSIDKNLNSILESIDAMKAQIVDLYNRGGGGGTTTDYEDNFNGSVSVFQEPLVKSYAIGVLSRMPNTIISITGTITTGSVTQPISSMDPYVNGQTLYIMIPAYTGRRVLAPTFDGSYNVIVKYSITSN